uniref:WAP domain-containing protein n=1 Tax=Chelonoidis abingdonii TaxID=106734 RepID=A0A8C0GEV6_CHEAB
MWQIKHVFPRTTMVLLPLGPISVAGKPGTPRKRGTCPPNLMKCLYTEPPLCLNDTDCRGLQPVTFWGAELDSGERQLPPGW